MSEHPADPEVIQSLRAAIGRASRHQRNYATPIVVTPDAPPIRCRCQAMYLDSTESREAHKTVFGHHPEPEKPRTAEE